MNERRAGDRPLGDLIDFDLPAEDVRQLARVDVLLRVVAADDLHHAIAHVLGLARGDPGAAGRCARW